MVKMDARQHSEAHGRHIARRCVLALGQHLQAGGDGVVEGSAFTARGQTWRVRLQRPRSVSCASSYVSVLLVGVGGNRGRTRARLQLVNHVSHMGCSLSCGRIRCD
jgi:hypothetical protein